MIDFAAELVRRNEQKNPPAEQEQGEQSSQTEIGFLESIPILEFTPKEISKMPTFFSQVFKLKGGKAAYIRKKENGTYEIRYRRDGFNISVSSKNLADAKVRFIQALYSAKPDKVNDKTIFGEYATQWLEVVKRPQVKENTLAFYRFTLQKYIIPRFGRMQLKDIKPIDVQKLLNDLEGKGIRRGTECAYVVLKAIFDFAVAEDLLTKSPMTLIRKPKHETKHGQAFTVEEEHTFVERCINSHTVCRYAYILMLFTGIRRSELVSVQVSAQWITVITAKTRKGESVKTRKIPVSPMLQPFLPFITKEVLMVSLDALTNTFKKIMPGRHLHELRHTFITRCQECGVSRELTSLWAGHKADNTMTSNVYTHFSEEFQLTEIQKLRY